MADADFARNNFSFELKSLTAALGTRLKRRVAIFVHTWGWEGGKIYVSVKGVIVYV